jgi:hypothetical protein
VAFLLPRPAHALWTQLYRQPVNQPRQLALAARLLDQAFLRRAKILGPVRLQRKSIKAELRIERGGLVGEQAPQVLRIAARNRGRDACDRDAAVDPETVKRQPSRAEMPFLQFTHESGNEPLERLRGRFGMGRRLLQPKCRTWSDFGGRSCQRLWLAAKHSIERIDDVFGSTKSPRERKPRNAEQRADGL